MKYPVENIIDRESIKTFPDDASKELGIYSAMPADYYSKRMGNYGLNDIWFTSRQNMTRDMVRKYYKDGVVLDIGCGNCLWNADGIPTIGIDINRAMLDRNQTHINNFVGLNVSISGGLPVKSGTVGMVVVTELIEHLPDYPILIEEIWRVLAPGGTVIASVPYGKFPGLWSLLFPAWCRYKYLKDNDEYYLNKCGHKVNFDFKKLAGAFGKFRCLEKKSLALLTIFVVARKAQ